MLNNFSLLWPIDTKLGVWVAYIKTQLGIATQVYVIKVKVTVTKTEFSFRSITLVCFGLLTLNLVHATNATKITTSFFIIAIFHFFFLSHKYLVESLKTWFSSHCGVSCYFYYDKLIFLIIIIEFYKGKIKYFEEICPEKTCC